jgi:hypothetical protein
MEMFPARLIHLPVEPKLTGRGEGHYVARHA